MSDELCSRYIMEFEAAAKTHVSIPGVREYFECPVNTLGPDRVLVLTELLRGHLNEYQERCGILPTEWPQYTSFEKFRIRRYDEDKGHYARHVDASDLASARRFLAFYFYLNDVEEGGETVFFNQTGEEEFRIKPKRGTLIMFPPLWTMPHAGLAPKSAPKYMAGSFLHFAQA